MEQGYDAEQWLGQFDLLHPVMPLCHALQQSTPRAVVVAPANCHSALPS